MDQVVQTPRTMKVFVASPSDVAEERSALNRLIRDINDVLTFLDPARNLRIELVGYETDSYPDYGSPQDVINRQIPVNYDIFVGIMWKRCGTPTQTAPSGTIEEYRRACEKRKQSGFPRVMFYFCDQPIALPTEEELEQLALVLKFRREVGEVGLISNYPTHASLTRDAARCNCNPPNVSQVRDPRLASNTLRQSRCRKAICRLSGGSCAR